MLAAAVVVRVIPVAEVVAAEFALALLVSLQVLQLQSLLVPVELPELQHAHRLLAMAVIQYSAGLLPPEAVLVLVML